MKHIPGALYEKYKKTKKNKTKRKSMEGAVQTRRTSPIDYSNTKQTVTRVKAPAAMPSVRKLASKFSPYKVNISPFTGWKDAKGRVLNKTKAKKMCKTHKKVMCKKCK